MKSLYVFSLVILLLSQMSMARADATKWAWACVAHLNNTHQLDPPGCGGGCGVNPAASDGYDSLDQMTTTGGSAYFGTYHVNGEDNWQGLTGYYREDIRAPLSLEPGQSLSWRIYVWADPSAVPAATSIRFGSGPGSSPPQLDVWLTMVSKPSGVSGGPAVGTRWHLSETLGAGTDLPIYRTTEGSSGYVFDLTATVIPEPSTLAALLAGLGGFGAVIRRRR